MTMTPRRLAALLVATMAVAILPLSGAFANHINDHFNVTTPPGPNNPVQYGINWSTQTFMDTDTDTQPATSGNVLIGRRDLFPDLLASGSLQGEDTPLLLTDNDTVSDGVIDQMRALGTQTFDILGGEFALSQAIIDQLEDAGFEFGTRFAGFSRIETAIDIADDNDSDTVILARAFGDAQGDETRAWADSLAGGGLAAENGWPVLLTQTDTLTENTRNHLSANATTIQEVKILGGNLAVSAAVEAEVQSLGFEVERIFGENRFGTAIEIAEFRGDTSSDDAERFLLVEGQTTEAYSLGFPAAAHSALNDAPIVLSNGAGDTTTDNAPGLPPETERWINGPNDDDDPQGDSGSEPLSFNVDTDNDDGAFPVIGCATSDGNQGDLFGEPPMGPDVTIACNSAREEAGLPVADGGDQEGNNAVSVTVGAEGETYSSDNPIPFTLNFDDDFSGEITFNGVCLLPPAQSFSMDTEDGELDVSPVADGECTINYEAVYDNGTRQVGMFPVQVESTV